MRGNMPKVVVLLIATGALLFGCGEPRDAANPIAATRLPTPKTLPNFALTDHLGIAFDRNSLRQRWSLLFFGFTHCPDICPATLSQLAAARSRLASLGAANALPTIVLISVDPERDTEHALSEYVSYFGEHIIGVSGDSEELGKLTAGLGVFFQKEPSVSGDYTVSHTTAVFLINPEAQFQALFSAPLTVDALVHDLPLLMAQR